MSELWIGLSAVHHQAMFEGSRPATLAKLLTSSAWPWPPTVIRPEPMPGQPVYPWPKGRVASARLASTLEDVARSPSAYAVTLVRSKEQRLDLASVRVETGRPQPADAGFKFPFRASALCRANDLPPGSSLEALLEVMHGLVALTESPNAVLFVGQDWRAITALQFGAAGDPSAPASRPAHEAARVHRARAELGDRWIRPPQWGTYLAAKHVEAAGGRERLVQTVQPDVVREVGTLLYLQLSARVEDALQPAIEAKRQVLANLLEPVTVPSLGDERP